MNESRAPAPAALSRRPTGDGAPAPAVQAGRPPDIVLAGSDEAMRGASPSAERTQRRRPFETVVDGRYRLLDRVGSGGTAAVYLAEDLCSAGTSRSSCCTTASPRMRSSSSGFGWRRHARRVCTIGTSSRCSTVESGRHALHDDGVRPGALPEVADP